MAEISLERNQVAARPQWCSVKLVDEWRQMFSLRGNASAKLVHAMNREVILLAAAVATFVLLRVCRFCERST